MARAVSRCGLRFQADGLAVTAADVEGPNFSLYFTKRQASAKHTKSIRKQETGT